MANKRVPEKDRRDHDIMVKVTKAEKRRILKMAQAEDRTASSWVRLLVLNALEERDAA